VDESRELRDFKSWPFIHLTDINGEQNVCPVLLQCWDRKSELGKVLALMEFGGYDNK
jgi:hypothetical protein